MLLMKCVIELKMAIMLKIKIHKINYGSLIDSVYFIIMNVEYYRNRLILSKIRTKTI